MKMVTVRFHLNTLETISVVSKYAYGITYIGEYIRKVIDKDEKKQGA